MIVSLRISSSVMCVLVALILQIITRAGIRRGSRYVYMSSLLSKTKYNQVAWYIIDIHKFNSLNISVLKRKEN